MCDVVTLGDFLLIMFSKKNRCQVSRVERSDRERVVKCQFTLLHNTGGGSSHSADRSGGRSLPAHCNAERGRQIEMWRRTRKTLSI